MLTGNNHFFMVMNNTLSVKLTETKISLHERRHLCGGNRAHKANVHSLTRANRKATKLSLKEFCD